MRFILSSLTVATAIFLYGSALSAETLPVAIERADGAKLRKAAAHYARSRALLISALREFDKATRQVNPDALLDADEWRASVFDRAEELQRVLAPQPRASTTGIRFEPDSRLLQPGGRQ